MGRGTNRFGWLAAIALPLFLSACEAVPPATDTASDPGLLPPAVPEPAPIVTGAPSETSAALAQHYRRLQSDLLARGLLRTDGGGPDTPITDTTLARNFVRIALFNEYADDGTTLISQATASQLRRWDQPIRMRIEFGAGVTLDQRISDRNAIRAYAGRLARLTGLQIVQTTDQPNFHVLVLTEDDRRAFEDDLRALVPGISNATVRAFTDLPRDQLCIVIGTFRPDGAGYDKAIALIRAEHPDLMRQACIHEELAQGLGLANDSPRARPSIFNDDEEFALLTTHDELLLRMLYDPRLRPGMRAAEAAPIARQIARELVAGQNS